MVHLESLVVWKSLRKEGWVFHSWPFFAVTGLFPGFLWLDSISDSFFGDIFSYCLTANLSFSYLCMWVFKVSFLYSLFRNQGDKSDRFQMLQFWVSCKLSRIANLLCLLSILLGLVSKCCKSKTYTMKFCFQKEHFTALLWEYLVSRNCFHTWSKLIPRQQCSLGDLLVVLSLDREWGAGGRKVSLDAGLISGISVGTPT